MEILLLSLLPVIFLIGSAVVTNKAVSRGAKRKKAVILQLLSFAAVLICCAAFPLVAGAAGAEEAAQEAAAASSNGLGLIGMAIPTAAACIAAGIAVAGAAPAAIGATSEDPKAFGKALIFVALGESIALYGLVIAIMILNKI